MDYTIVELPKSQILGPTIRVSNDDPQCPEKIGKLWGDFMTSGIDKSIPDPIVEPYTCYGLYYNYDFTTMEYDMMVGCASNTSTLPDGLERITIPAGKYAKFSTRGNVVQAVIDAWNEIWTMEELATQRSYTVDFEAYLPGEDMDNCEIELYIALK